MKKILSYLVITIAITSSYGQAAAFQKLFSKNKMPPCAIMMKVEKRKVLILDMDEKSYLNDHRHISQEVIDLIKSDKFNTINFNGDIGSIGSSFQDLAAIIPSLTKLNSIYLDLSGRLTDQDPSKEYELLIQKTFNSSQLLYIYLHLKDIINKNKETSHCFTINPKGLSLKKAVQ
ncbi:hypothetical protein JKY79_01695 [Candidatus Babeliales bacterium]|nr:hypothetical protein [Candidatus Babeliales bacterium]